MTSLSKDDRDPSFFGFPLVSVPRCSVSDDPVLGLRISEQRLKAVMDRDWGDGGVLTCLLVYYCGRYSAVSSEISSCIPYEIQFVLRGLSPSQDYTMQSCLLPNTVCRYPRVHDCAVYLHTDQTEHQ